MKPSELIRVLEDPSAPSLTQHDEGSLALLTLLAHVYFADGHVDEGELVQLRRLTSAEDVQARLAELAAAPHDLDRLAALYPDPQDRDDIITLAEHAVWGDDEVDGAEWDLIDQLVEKLGVVRE